MLICQETPYQSSAAVRILGLGGYAMERLCIVTLHTSMADTHARRQDEFVSRVVIRELALWEVRLALCIGCVFPRILIARLTRIWVRRGKVVKVGDAEPVDLGVVCDLAVALVEHVFADCVERVEFPAPAVAVYADVVHDDLFCEVIHEAGEVDEVVGVGDEEGVGGGHVGEVVLEGWRRCGAEETGGGGGVYGVLLWLLCGPRGALDGVVLVPFGIDVGGVGILGGV